jgi:gliding motility-associated-like protein
VSRLVAFANFSFLRLLPVVFILVFRGGLQAQLCTGSLGDPAVNITFGPGNGSSVTTPLNGYIYTSSSCPDDGYFTITNATSNCFGNTWHSVSSDHTGNGSFMLVNASFAPGDFFVTTVTDLCPNTTYEFAAWIMNVLNRSGIMPNITFKIETPDGIVLKEYNTGDINSSGRAEWKQYGFFFTTPLDNAKIVLRMTNNAPGGLGNDLALDDITFRPCGAMINANIQGMGNTVDVCEINTNTYSFNGSASSGYLSPVYQWQLSMDSGKIWNDIPGATTTSYIDRPSATGNYWYRLTVIDASVAGQTSCRIASNILVVNVHSKPVVDAGPDRIILTGNSAVLVGKAEGDSLIYSWSPGTYISDVNDLTPTISPATDIIYTLFAQSSHGCANEDNVQVKVVTGIYVPTAFTPNNDGKNDDWQIPFLDPAFGAEVSVFNRWGQLVYHSVGTVVSWDGTLKGMPQPAGAYVYLVTIPGNFNLKGIVILIR